MKTRLLLFAPVLIGLVHARSISVNLTPWPIVDAQLIDPDEVSFVGIAGAETINGANWNEINLRNAGSAGVPDFFTAATQGGSHIDLADSTGTDSGIDLTSTGSFYAGFANVSTPNQAATGDAGLMQGFLNLAGTAGAESIELTGLSSWAPNGYKVIAVFDIGGTRTYSISMTDGTLSQEFWTADTAGTDSDPENDGVMAWIETTATTSGTAVTDANYAIYGTFTGDTLTISGGSTGGRATLNGFQVVPLPESGLPVLDNPSVSSVTSSSADASVRLSNSDASEVVFHWDTIDRGTGPWPNSTSLGPQTVGTVSGTATGLSPDTVYYYRFLATNDVPDPDLSSWSPAASVLTTPLSGLGITDLDANLVEIGEIELSWTDVFTTETGFSIRRGESPGGPYDEIAVLPADSTSYSDDNPLLEQGVTYYYTVVATNDLGESDPSNEDSETNGPTPPPSPASAVISINHTVDAANSGRLPQPLASTDLGGLVPDAFWNNVTLPSAHVSPTAVNGSIPAGSLLDGSGTVVAGASYSLTSTSSYCETVPAFESSFGDGDRNLFGDVAQFNDTDNFDLTVDGLDSTYTDNGYRVILYTMGSGNDRSATWSFTPEGQPAITRTSAAESPNAGDAFTTAGVFRESTDDATPGNYLTFDVPAGIDGFSLGVTATNGPRMALNGLQIVAADNPILSNPAASSITGTSADVSVELGQTNADVTLYWDSIDQGPGGTWANSSALGSQTPGTVGDSITGFAPDTRVFYRFHASRTSPDLETWSAEASSFATALAGKAVADLSAAPVSPTSIVIDWTDNFASEIGYRILWSSNSGGPFTEIDAIAADSESYVDTGALPGPNYYQVVAFNENGDSDASNTAVAEPGETFGSWITGFGLAFNELGTDDDPDGDQLDNLVEAFLGTDPSQPNAGIADVATDGTVTTFTHPQADPQLVDVNGSYEWSLDLENWYAGDGVDGPVGGPTVDIPAVTPTAGTASVTATASEALPALFIRILVSQ